MARFTETVATINSAVRTMLAVAVMGIVGIGGWYGYRTYNKADLEMRAKDQEIARKDEELAKKEQQIGTLKTDLADAKRRAEMLETKLRLLKVDHRLARLTILDQGEDAAGQVYTEVEFQEMNDQGQPIDGPRTFRVVGKMVHVSCWLVKFEDRYVETAAVDRATTLCLFKTIYGEGQKPMDGFPLDRAGTAPGVYSAGQQMSAFEQQIWSDFWNIANDEARARELGIRAAHGQAVIVEARPGKQYKILLRASDGLSIVPDGETPKPSRPIG